MKQRRFQILLSALLLAFLPGIAQLGAQSNLVRSGINTEILSDSLDPGDMKIILEHIISTAVFGELEHESKIYDNSDQLLGGLERKEFDIFAMTTIPFIENMHKDMEPSLVLSWGGKKLANYVLLSNARRGKGKTLADYRDANVTLVDGGVTDLVHMWLDVTLDDAGFQRSRKFFGDIKYVEKPNQAAIPVFFGKSELCVIKREQWEVLAELNPQMKTRLTVVAESPPVLEGVLLLRASMDKGLKGKAVDGLLRMHENPEGAQILKFGKIDQIVSFEAEDLEPTLALHRKHRSILSVGAGAGEAAELVTNPIEEPE